MKKLILILLLLSPLSAFAVPVSWDYSTNILQPLQSIWNNVNSYVKIPQLTVTGTSTLATTTTSDLTVNGNATTTGYISSAFNSQFGNANQYWKMESLDLGAGGIYPILSAYSDGAFGNVGAIADNLILYDKAGVNKAQLLFANNSGTRTSSLYYTPSIGTEGLFTIDAPLEVNGAFVVNAGDISGESFTIGATTLEVEWPWLDGLNQSLSTNSDVDFNSLTTVGTIQGNILTDGFSTFNLGNATTTGDLYIGGKLNGNLTLSTTVGVVSPAGIIYKGTNPFIHDFNYGLNGGGITTSGNNIFVGIGAGNLTMGSTATQIYHASYNTVIGGSALSTNTTGYYNTAIGYNTLNANTTGANNTAIGYQSLFKNTAGANNTAYGNFALVNLAGTYLATSDNLGLGYSAGRYQGSGTTALTTASQSVYIGSYARGFSNSDVNSIVIGYNAVGLGANTVVLGNDSIVTTALKGSVTVGNNLTVSGTGTSTIAGDLAVDTDTLYVNSMANRVGVLNASPATALQVGNSTLAAATYISVDSALNRVAGYRWYDGGTSVFNLFKNNDSTGNLNLTNTGNTSVMFFKQTGEIGVGTTTPAKKIDIYHATATSTAYIYSGGAGLGGSIILEDAGSGACTEISTSAGTILSKVVVCP